MPVSESEANKIYDICDANKDGIVTKLELLKGLNKYFSQSLSADQVTDMFIGLDSDGDDKITRKEFVDQLCHKMNRREGFIKAFNEIDKNKDGSLSHDELRAVCRKCGHSDDEINQMIKAIDTDGDGQISMAEFMKLV